MPGNNYIFGGGGRRKIWGCRIADYLITFIYCINKDMNKMKKSMSSLSRGRVERCFRFTRTVSCAKPKWSKNGNFPFAKKEDIGRGGRGYCVCATVELFTSVYKSLIVSLHEHVPPFEGSVLQME